MALTSYATLTTALGTWDKRTYTSDQTDEAILLTEARANRKLASDFRRRTSATINTDASGVGTLPTSFIGMVSLTRDVAGSLPLRMVPYGALIERNPYEVSSDSDVYALLSNTSLQVAPVTDDNFIAVYSTVVPALSGSNTTNWLLSLAPDYYLFGCQAALAARRKSYGEAAALQSQADDILSQIVSQGNVAEYGNAEMTFPMRAP